MANILFGKTGKSLLFSPKKWSPVGGDMEAPYLLFALARFYPEHTFWIISKSDYSKVYPNGLSMFPNIKNLWSSEYWEDGIDPMTWSKDTSNEEQITKFYKYPGSVFDRLGLTIDFAILCSGINFNNAIEFNKVRQDGQGFARCLQAATFYLSFIVWTLNERKIPYVNIITDPRQDQRIRDLIHLPLFYPSQIDRDIPYGVTAPQYWMKQPTTVNADAIMKFVYARTEYMTMLFRKPVSEVKNFDKEWFRKKSGFNMIVNEGLNHVYGSPRYHELKKYVLDDPNFECSIYGKWSPELTEGEPRFKGQLSPLNLGDVLNTTKYTFCISIDDGWMTAKFVEMCHYGVIPFLHKNYGHEVKESYIDPYFYVESREELFNKISELENSEEKYFEVVEKIRKVLFEHGDSIYTGGSSVYELVRSIHKMNPEYSDMFPMKKEFFEATEHLSDYIVEKKISMADFF